jgi:HAE1 family hydrophobic/amphiphilic exporter-1
LVDDSIVVLENINRHLTLGEEPVVAAINGRSEIGYAALTLTAVDLVVFLPIAFMGGVIGQFFRSFGVTVAFATLFSMFVSFTLTPMLAARWYQKGEKVEFDRGFAGAFDRNFHRFERFYQKILRWCLTYRYVPRPYSASANPSFGQRTWLGLKRFIGWWMYGPRIVLLIGNLFLILVFIFIGSKLGFQFSPNQDQNQVTALVQCPAGASLAYTQNITRQVEAAIWNNKTIAHDTRFVATTIGNAGPGLNENGTQYAHVDLTLYNVHTLLNYIDPNKMDIRMIPDTAVAALVNQAVKNIPGAVIQASNVSGFGGGAPPLEVDLLGPDFD